MEAHVAAGVTLLVALSVGSALVATTRLVKNQSIARASTDVDAARVVFHQLLKTRAVSAAALIQLVTTLPVFRAHLTDARLVRDGATMLAMADDYRSQLHADFCVVTDARGQAIATSGWPADQALPAQMRATVAVAVKGRSQADILAVGRSLVSGRRRAGAVRRRDTRHDDDRLQARRRDGGGARAGSSKPK